MKLLIKHGRVIDPANQRDEKSDILIDGNRIAQIAKRLTIAGAKTIEASGKIVLPGIIDMHVHLREPGREDQETIASATAAALKGGITTVLAMPNTEPSIDSPELVARLQALIAQSARANVYIAGAITIGRKGEKLVDIAGMKKQGALALTDDGASVDNPSILSAAFKKAKEQKLLVMCHCEDKKLSGAGCVNLGFISTRMGLRGISKESEYLRVKRDIELAQSAGAPIHITHVSCQESVEVIARAKKQGLRVSADTAPHYFALTEEAVLRFDTNMKMNPPLRTKADVAAIKQGLRDGTIDAIASDHAPHKENEKDIEFDFASFGVIGLETELAVCISELIETKVLDWTTLVQKLATNPARILGLEKGTLGVGGDADLIVLAPERAWTVEQGGFLSKSKNSPFLGRKLKGVVEYTLHKGKIAYQAK
ncbi:MAG: dihydroorotase [Candidatus Omnitrophota bacterium]